MYLEDKPKSKQHLLKPKKLITILQQVFNDFCIKNPLCFNNTKLIIHVQANTFCTNNKQCGNKKFYKNTSKLTTILKYYNCTKLEHFSCNCQKPPTQLIIEAQAKKVNPSANVVKVIKVLVVPIVQASVFIE